MDFQSSPPTSRSRCVRLVIAQVVVYRADGSVTVLGVGDTLLGDTVLPGVAMALAVLFAAD